MDKDLIHRLATLLDAALPLLDQAAKREARRENGKPMRCITAARRARASRDLLEETFELLRLANG